MRTAVRNMSETTVNKAHELQRGMVNMQHLTSIAQNQWKIYLQQAEDNYVEDTTSTEAGHHSIGQILNDWLVLYIMNRKDSILKFLQNSLFSLIASVEGAC